MDNKKVKRPSASIRKAFGPGSEYQKMSEEPVSLPFFNNKVEIPVIKRDPLPPDTPAEAEAMRARHREAVNSIYSPPAPSFLDEINKIDEDISYNEMKMDFDAKSPEEMKRYQKTLEMLKDKRNRMMGK